MKQLLVLALLLSCWSCSKSGSSPTAPSNNTPLFSISGNGNSVFSLPSTVNRARITGTYTGFSSNFILWIGPNNVACGTTITGSCHLIVNELLGTGWPRTVTDGTYQVGGLGTAAMIIDSTGVAWTFTEVR